MWLARVGVKGWARLSTRQYKDFKGLTKENLKDNMSTLELILNMLAEATTTELSKTVEPKNLNEDREVEIKGGSIAGNARKEIESTTGKSVINRKECCEFY